MSSHSSYDGRSVWPPLASSPSHQQEAASASSASPASRRRLQRRRPGSSASISGTSTPPASFRPLARHDSMPGKIGRSPRLGDSVRFGSAGGLKRQDSNPFLRKPLALARSSESLSLLPSQMQQQQQQGSSQSMTAAIAAAAAYGSTTSIGSSTSQNTNQISCASNPHHVPLAPLERTNAATPIHRHLTLLDLIAVGVGGTLGTGIFVLCPLLISSHAGPSAILCWMIAAAPALLSGLCFAELSGQIPAAGSTYAYTYAAMGELPAVVAAGCLCLEYLVSAAAVARGWGDKVVDWICGDGYTSIAGTDFDAAECFWKPNRTTFNPMACGIAALTTALLLSGAKESQLVTNYFTAFKCIFVVVMTAVALGLFDPTHMTPFVPAEFGVSGVLQGSTAAFFGYVGFDEVCCLAAEAKEPQKNMPRAIGWTIAILVAGYVAATLALAGLLPYTDISPVGGFPDAFETRGVDWAASAMAIGEVGTLPLVVLVAVMAQPRLQYALAADGLLPEWFGILNEAGDLWNGTLFAGIVMTFIASFVPFENLNDMISAGVLVAFSMTNSSLILLRHESPDESPFLLEKLLTTFNVLALLTALLLTYCFTSVLGIILTSLCFVVTLLSCVLIKAFCPEASFFGGKTRTTTQHVQVGVKPVEEEEYRTPMLPFVPCLGIFVNWYLIAQLSLTGFVMLVVFLAAAMAFYFSYGYFYSVGQAGGWDNFHWHGYHDEAYGSIPYSIAEHGIGGDDENGGSDSVSFQQGLPIDDVDGDVEI